MAPIFTRETFRFFKELKRNNRKEWMDANRARYKTTVVEPFKKLLEEIGPHALKLDSRFNTMARHGANFSRINRDIRFAKDKTPYRAHMYLKLSCPFPGGAETGQLYAGLSVDVVTLGFRIYAGSKRKVSAVGMLLEQRVLAKPKWIAQQKKRLSKRYESYWYKTVKGEWTKVPGWPQSEEDWKKLQGWIVRRKLTPAAAIRPSFVTELQETFRELCPLVKFTSLPD